MKKKVLLITIATIIALMFAVTAVMAAEEDQIDDINEMFKEDTDKPTNEDASNILAGQENVANTQPTTNTESANNQPAELVNTGSGEVSIALVVVLVVSSAYAYKKVKEYNA